MDFETYRLDEMNPAPYNPRKTLKPGDPQYEALKESIQRFDLVEPIIVNERTGNIVGGHQRYNVLKAMGITETTAVVVNLDEDKERLLNITLNKLEGQWDFEKLQALFDEIPEEDIPVTGFSKEELDELFRDAETDEDLFGDAYEEGAAGDSASHESDSSGEKEAGEFTVFLSFPSKDQAENWMKNEGIERDFPHTGRNLVIHMEGIEYGDS